MKSHTGFFLRTWDDPLPWRDERYIWITLATDTSASGWGGSVTLGDRVVQVSDYWTDEEQGLPQTCGIKKHYSEGGKKNHGCCSLRFELLQYNLCYLMFLKPHNISFVEANLLTEHN